MVIVYFKMSGIGYSSITHMVQLAAELFEAELLGFDSARRPQVLQKLEAFLPRRRGNETCLIVCPNPGELQFLLQVEGWRRRFRRIVAWVIDAHMTEHIPWISRLTRVFDQIFVTREEDVPGWSRAAKAPIRWLPWGTDAFRLGSGAPNRVWDLIRVGRQPPEWEDDRSTERACHPRGLSFHGRPEAAADDIENTRHVMRVLGQCKFTLAFSNTVDSSWYTHATRPYITGRWVDAIASGVVVAGIVPKMTAADRLLWPGATLDLGSIRRDEGLAVIESAVREWRSEIPAEQRRLALERLDWRWRFLTIADDLGESPKALHEEIGLLRQMASHHE